MPPDAPHPLPHQLWPRLVHIIRTRPRLSISILVSVIVTLALVGRSSLPERMLIDWDVGVALYLVAAFQLNATSIERSKRRWAAIEDEGLFGISFLTAGAALASLGATIDLLTSPHVTSGPPNELALGTVAVLLSLAFIHTIFGLHYSHEYYGEGGCKCGGLIFPGDEKPDYWDFVYFSFVLSMTSQDSDVSISPRGIRRTIVAHGVVAFLFNAALLALTVNTAASAILSSSQ